MDNKKPTPPPTPPSDRSERDEAPPKTRTYFAFDPRKMSVNDMAARMMAIREEALKKKG